MENATNESSPGLLAAINKAAKAAKAVKPAKAKKAAPAKKPAAKAKAKKEPKMTETSTQTQTPAVDPIDALMAEFGSASFDDKDFLRAMLQKAFDAGKAAPRARAPRAGGPTKRDLAAALLRRPEGATTRDILDVTQWPAVSVPAIARASGLSLRMEKTGRVTTYFGT
jgi:hypothetical protein